MNLLLLGSDDVVWRVLGSHLSLGTPIVTWEPGRPFVLPAVACARTVVLREVGQLSPLDQVRLLDWLERAVGRTQVVSTSSTPLLSQVEEGEFLSALYYRLNTICVDLAN
ncbi:MAG: sigma 54-interacting transcriptional regulator, partial [Vicinamibacterales bacterium]